MIHRLRLFQAATALLYFGPLLAGLSGHGWAMVPLFSAIFVLWSMVIRPHLWPRRAADLVRGEALLALAALVATQVLIVAVSFAVGRGLGGVAGLRPDLPIYLPAALSFLAVPLSRLAWDPDTADRAQGFDPLLHKPAPSSQSTPEALARDLFLPLVALPDDIGEADLQVALTGIAGQVDPAVIRRVLENAALHRRATPAARKALIIHATDPDVAQLLSGSLYPARAFLACDDAAELLTLFAIRCARVVEDEPALAPDCPAIPALTAATHGLGAGEADKVGSPGTELEFAL